MIKSMQHIEGTGQSSAQGPVDVTINEVDVSRAVISRSFWTRQAGENRSVTYTFLDSTTVRVYNDTTDTGWPFALDVIEYL